MKNVAPSICAKVERAEAYRNNYERNFVEVARAKKPPKGSEAIEFLRMLLPHGLWTFTAIIPDGPTETRTFKVAEQERARAFIVQANEGCKNIYYSPPTRGVAQ